VTTTPPPSDRTRVRREADRGHYDRATVDAILDGALLCHLAFVHDGWPYAVPTLHARVGDVVYVHGSTGSRMLRTLTAGAPACLTVTILDGMVLARSAFNSSVNYRSAMLFGTLTAVPDEDRPAALEALTEKLVPGRWAETRPPDRRELAKTTILRMPITEASAKVRTGPPSDGDGPDAALPHWAGVVPLRTSWGEPVPDTVGVPLPPSVRRLTDGG
jgi:nitroimidazol reductase NimA-like FMN-containing flavoprotein (pyridoxamine 5'-phosphate oxidase superfamily)